MRWTTSSSRGRVDGDDAEDDVDVDDEDDGRKPSTSTWRAKVHAMRRRMKKKRTTATTATTTAMDATRESRRRSDSGGRTVSMTTTGNDDGDGDGGGGGEGDDDDGVVVDAASDPDALRLANAERDAAKLDAERCRNELKRVELERALERASLTDELAASAERVSRQRSEIERLKEEIGVSESTLEKTLMTPSAAGFLLDDICRTVTAFTAEFADAGLVEGETARRVAENPKIWIEPPEDSSQRIGDLLRAVLDAHESVCADYEEKIVRAKTASELEMRSEVERLLGELELAEKAASVSGSSQKKKNGSLLYRTPDVVKQKNNRVNREAEAELRELRDALAEARRQTHQLSESSKDIERELRQQLDESNKQLDEVLQERDVVIKNLKLELEQLERAETERRGVATRAKEAEIANLNALVEDLTAEVKRLKDTLTKQRQLKEKLEERVAGSEARIEGLLQEIDAMDAASAQASEHVSNAMTSAAEAHARAMAEMRAKMAEAEAYIEALDARESSMEDERSVLKRELDKAYAREKDLRLRIQDTEKRSNALTDEINALLEQDARRTNALLSSSSSAGGYHHHHPQQQQQQPRLTRVTSSTKKLDVREISDEEEEEDDDDEYFVVQRRSKTAPNTPSVTTTTSPPLSPRQLNGLNSVNSALARARAELNAARAKRDRNIRKLELL